MSDESLKLSNQICFPLYAASRLMTKAYAPYLEELEITYPQYLVLLVLWEKDGLPVKHIGEKLLLNTNTITPLLKRMEKQGLLRRERSKKDERNVIVCLTEKGKNLKEKAKHIPGEMLQKLSSEHLIQQDLAHFRNMLSHIIQRLSSEE